MNRTIRIFSEQRNQSHEMDTETGLNRTNLKFKRIKEERDSLKRK